VTPKAQGTSTVASLHARGGDDAAPAADRGFFSFALWGRASATGAALLWRIRTDSAGPRAEHVQDLSDRSWLAHLKKSTDRTGTPPMLVRVVLHDRRRTGQPRGLPVVHHAAGPRRGVGHRAGCGLPRAVGDRPHLLRAQDPPTRTPPGAAPATGSGSKAIGRLAYQLNPARRLRAAPRVIKRKMPKWHVKRRHHADWPRPQHPPNYLKASN